MIRQIDLREYESSAPIKLSRQEVRGLQSLRANERGSRLLSIEPWEQDPESYVLTPGSTVGAIESDDFSLLIRPKIGIPQLLSIACYTVGIYRARELEPFDFEEEKALPDALALALTSAANQAFARGLRHGYRMEEDALYTVRGRIRFEGQAQRRFNRPLPVEVRYDEFTDDILDNRLIKAAVYRLRRMRLRSAEAGRRLGRIAGLLDNVTLAEFPRNNVPEVSFNRLNEHYRHVVGLSRLILRHGEFEAGRGTVRANGFLFDMNRLFQEFVCQALRESLNVTARVLGEQTIGSLDTEGRVMLRPDLVWRDRAVFRFVADVKYKSLVSRNYEPPNEDLYQLLAYLTAADLAGGMLIYAQGEAEPAKYVVRHAGKMLEVVALDLELPLDAILEQVGDIANRMLATDNWPQS